MKNEYHSIEKLHEIISGEKGLLAYFYSDRCAPCVSLRPKVETLVSEYFQDMKMVFVNSEAHPDISAHYGIFANPCILVFFEGHEFRRYSKYISISQLGSDIQRVYSLLFDN